MSSEEGRLDAAGRAGKSGTVERKAFARMVATGLALVVAVLVAGFLVYRFIGSERDRELTSWQTRMGIIADSRLADLSDWIGAQMGALRAIADNASVQLYMTVLHDPDSPASGEDAPAELQYLGNYLNVVAERAGFIARSEPTEVNANVSRVGVAGMALVDARGKLVVSSKGMPPIEGRLSSFLSGVSPGTAAISDVFEGADGEPAIAFAVPVLPFRGSMWPLRRSLP